MGTEVWKKYIRKEMQSTLLKVPCGYIQVWMLVFSIQLRPACLYSLMGHMTHPLH